MVSSGTSREANGVSVLARSELAQFGKGLRPVARWLKSFTTIVTDAGGGNERDGIQQ